VYIYNGKKIKGTILINNVNYPLEFFYYLSKNDPNKLSDLGVAYVVDPILPDPELFTYTENDDGSLNIVARSQQDILNNKKNKLENAVQNLLDTTAQSKGYDGIISACSYTGAANPFQVESQQFVIWRGGVWSTCYSIMAQVIAGSMPIPTESDLLAMLPVYKP
jgi:hypothetical protein